MLECRQFPGGCSMASPNSCAQWFRFGLFEADAAQCTLMRNGVRVKIQEQPFRVLIVLLERAGAIVTREELRAKLWPEGTFVDFDGSLNVILKKLRAALEDNSDNPVFIETIPRRGYRFIAPVTMSKLSKREESVAGVSEVCSAEDPAAAENAELQPSTHPYLIYVAASVAIVLFVAIAWSGQHRTKGASAAAGSRLGNSPIPVRESIAVLGFYNVSGNPNDAWLGTALSDMLSTELAAGEKLRLTAAEDIANLRLSSPWSQTDTLNRSSAARIGSALNADYLVLGSYTVLGSSNSAQLRVDIRMQDAKTGEILTEIAEISGNQNLFPLVSRLGSSLRNRLGVPNLADTDQAGVLASMPVDDEAARLYALGVAKLRAFDILGAKDLLLQATEADPKFSLGHMMLSRAWGQLGYEQNRRDEIKKALALAQDLPRSEHMLVEADYEESLGNHEKAVSVYHALFELFPDSVDYGLTLAATQLAAGLGSQAAETIQQLRRLPPPASEDPRIDLADAEITKNKPAALALIRRALQKISVQQNRLLYAQARKQECLTLLYSENPAQGPPSCHDAYSIFMAAGNRLGAADSLRLLADGLGTQGHLEEAISTYQHALSVLQGLGEYEKTGAIVNNMAINFENEGKLDDAERLYREAKLDFEQAGDKGNAATALANLGDTAYLHGNLAAAAKSYEEALQIIGTMDPAHPGYAMYRLADLDLTRGLVADAKRLAEQAVAIIRPEQGGLQYLTGAMIVLGETLEAEGDLAGARQQFEDTLKMRQQIGALDIVAESQTELAALALQEGQPEQAEKLLQSALPTFEKDQSDPAASSALLLLSRALIMEDKPAPAREALSRAARLAHNTPDPALQLPIVVQAARINSLYPESVERVAAISMAEQQLRSAAATAKKLGYYRLECEARLALGEIEAKQNPALAQAQLRTLVSEERVHGLELLSRQTEEVMARSSNMVATTGRSH